VQNSNLADVAVIAATGNYLEGVFYDFNGVLKSDGTAWAWGYNGFGQLGDGTTIDSITPVAVSGFSEGTRLAVGFGHTVALKSDGTVYAWGYNHSGQLGDGTTTDSSVPVAASGFGGGVAVAAGGYHTVALKSNGTVWAWGKNTYGQLGIGTGSGSYGTPMLAGGPLQLW
jgi:YD repeat-containing protein